MDLAASLREFTDDELLVFLTARPDLVERGGSSSFVDLAARSLQLHSLQSIASTLTCFEQEVLDALLHLGTAAASIDVAALPAQPSDPALIEPTLNRLRVLGLVTRVATERGGHHYEVVKEVRRVVPAPFALHPPLAKLLDRYSVPDLRTMAFNVGLPERTIGKVGLISDLISRIGTPEGLSRVFERGSFEAESLLRSIHDDLFAMLPLDTRPWTRSTIPEQIGWLLGHGLLLPLSVDTVVIAREVAVVLRGGAPTPSFTPTPPEVITRGGHLSPSVRSPGVEFTASGVVEAVAAIGSAWARNPPVPLRTDGVGVKDIRALAKGLGIDERATARLIELGGLAGLFAVDPFANQVGPTTAFDEWLADEPLSRWCLLAHTWAHSTTSLSRVVRRDDSERSDAPLSPTWESSVDEVWRRARVVEALGAASRGESVDVMSVAQRARWFSPARWGIALDYLDRVETILEEASLIGAMAGGSLTDMARALWLDPAPDALERAAERIFKPAVSVFTVSGDLSAIAPSELSSSVALELGLLADLVSKGGAVVYRFTESSLRGALDHGRSVAEIHEFLANHARPGVPQPLTYLIDDVGRRYGSVRVGSALAYVRVDDPAVMAELVRAKKVGKLRLRQLAPTVAVSTLAPVKVVKALREAGFLPVEEGENGVVVKQQAVALSGGGRTRNRQDSAKSAAVWGSLRGATEKGGPSVAPVVGSNVRALLHTLRAKG